MMVEVFRFLSRHLQLPLASNARNPLHRDRFEFIEEARQIGWKNRNRDSGKRGVCHDEARKLVFALWNFSYRRESKALTKIRRSIALIWSNWRHVSILHRLRLENIWIWGSERLGGKVEWKEENEMKFVENWKLVPRSKFETLLLRFGCWINCPATRIDGYC